MISIMETDFHDGKWISIMETGFSSWKMDFHHGKWISIMENGFP
jgi:hypothetical protein